MADDKTKNLDAAITGLIASTALFIVLLILKLGVANTAVVGWSWWVVTMPLWWGFALLASIAVIFAVGLSLAAPILLIDWIYKCKHYEKED